MSENTNGAEEAPEETAAEETLTPEVNETEQDAAPESETTVEESNNPAPESEELDVPLATADPIATAEAFIKKVEGSPYAIAHEAKAIIEGLVALIKA